MRILSWASGALICATAAVTGSTPLVYAGYIDVPDGGTSIDLTLQIAGTSYDDADTKPRPCNPGYTFYSTTRYGTFESMGAPNTSYTRTVDGVVQTLFFTVCGRDDLNDSAAGPIAMNQRTVWVSRPAASDIIPLAAAEIQELIYPPVVSWPTMDREFGWLYVNTDMEFRVAALVPVEATLTLSNILATVTVTQTATPVSVTFMSGEPDGGSTSCSVEQAAAPFAVDVVGECSYRYRSSSAVSPNGRTFDSRMVVTWEVTGDLAPGDPTVLETFVDSPIAVAEIQAVVCSKAGC